MTEFNVRQKLEQAEERLSPLAARSAHSQGRQAAEAPCLLRTDFQRDRDRIIFSNAFRRLKHKTQVFIAPLGDHYVTRLTHTLEVSQIARTVSRALNMNEDLAEAIAMGHDLGHTPFGHIGEQALDKLLPGGFRHYEQSLRVVDCLERDGQGLNLTWEVRDGILHHSKGSLEIPENGWGNVSTYEGQIVKIADLVAYINHDVEDAVRAGLISQSDLPSNTVRVLGTTNGSRINTLVTDIVEDSQKKMAGSSGIKASIGMSPRIRDAANELREFLFEKVYFSGLDQTEVERARNTIEFLFDYYMARPENLPTEYSISKDNIERRVADYIAGMTDHYAILSAEKLRS